MASNATYNFFLDFLFLSLLFAVSFSPPAVSGQTREGSGVLPNHVNIQELNGGERNARRMLIGSAAPVCTYNECRGCKSRCRAEEVPVDANDPINSAYHYRCVCQRQ